MTTNPLGLYVHIPFCVKKCNYCDFCSFRLSDVSVKEEYIDSLINEIFSYKHRKLSLDTIFFGGGTPSLLSCEEFSRIVDAINESFDVTPDCEFTVEVNPGTITEEKARAFASKGVNRISIGLQSIHENELKTLGRIHNYQEFLSCYRLIKDCGISNVNIDVMYGIPHQTVASFLETLETVTSLNPSHLSLYGLILEEGTPFFENKACLPLPGEDIECDMYFLATEFMKKHGYTHYEISNYAKDGKESRHNLKYWRCQEYIGVGLAAYSCFDGKRFGNTENMQEYISQNAEECDYEEALTKEALAYEYVMLGLRLKDGILLSEYKKLFGVDFMLGREKTVEDLVSNQLSVICDDRFSLTERGFYVSNSILTDLL